MIRIVLHSDKKQFRTNYISNGSNELKTKTNVFKKKLLIRGCNCVMCISMTTQQQ